MDEKRKLSRRGFVGAAGGAAAAASLGPLVPGASGHGRGGRRGDRLLPRDSIGIQLFTVRNQVSALGFEAVFARLSDDRLPRDRVRRLQRAGPAVHQRGAAAAAAAATACAAIGSHVNYYSADPAAYSFVTQLEQVLDDAEEIGLPYIGTASRPGPALRRDGRWLPARRRGLQPVRRRRARPRAALLPPPPLRGVRRRERHAALRRPARGDRPAARVLRVRDLLVARRPDALPGLQAVRVPVGHARALPALPRQGRRSTTAARARRRRGPGPYVASAGR